jgi:hypothetical protein
MYAAFTRLYIYAIRPDISNVFECAYKVESRVTHTYVYAEDMHGRTLPYACTTYKFV